MTSFCLHIKGRVQGVGFRPYVYSLARARGINGTVSNGRQGVKILWESATVAQAVAFREEILRRPPARAIITGHTFSEIGRKYFQDFKILLEEEENAEATVHLSPDFALCEDCRREFNDPDNRRYQYPFITCTLCGPRFSIQRTVPYEREFTAMHTFEMCGECEQEYHDPADRRFFSQTNSCQQCGVRTRLLTGENQQPITGTVQMAEAILQALAEGQTVAVKGIGGFLLMCDAASPEAVARLRQRKHRPEKPLAVLFRDLMALRQCAEVSTVEADELTGPVSPIVVVRTRPKAPLHLAMRQLSPGLHSVGAMLPYAPLLQWLSDLYPHPLVATSANRSGDALMHRDDQIPQLFEFADLVLAHNREIIHPQDDSVVIFPQSAPFKTILRRGRGLAPAFFSEENQQEKNITAEARKAGTLLAMGAMMKSTFSVHHSGRVFSSQYLGNTAGADAAEQYEAALRRSLQLLQATPRHILADLHPAYPATRAGRRLAAEIGLPFTGIQHHLAHFAAVLGENRLFTSDEPVLGATWDGTGYGTNGHIWGSEFFVYHRGEVQWQCAFQPFPHIAGDLPAKQPRLAAFCALSGMEELQEALASRFTEQEWKLYRTLLPQSKLQNRSAGRYFDAVSSLLGLCQRQGYQGQAPMLLEQLARQVKNEDIPATKARYQGGPWLDLQPLVAEVFALHSQGETAAAARHFHRGLASLVGQVARYLGIKQVALSGGVFQNTLLMDELHRQTGDGMRLYAHRQLSPNDENVSYGQLMAFQYLKNLEYVFGNTRKNTVH